MYNNVITHCQCFCIKYHNIIFAVQSTVQYIHHYATDVFKIERITAASQKKNKKYGGKSHDISKRFTYIA